MTDFKLDVHQNEFLSHGEGEVHAIVTVAATSGGAAALQNQSGKVVIIMGDVSGSMQEPLDPDRPGSPVKMVAAIDALRAAVGQIEDGTEFAVIAGTDQATMVYPTNPGLAMASPRTRSEAAEQISKLRAGGGTAMSTWLMGARMLFGLRPNAICQGILITDGKNDSDKPGTFEQEIARCVGIFECDCRGVGVKWNVAEVRKVATALLGEVEMIRDSTQMSDDFKDLIAKAMQKQTNEVKLHVWTPKSAKLLFVRQVAPAIDDLTTRGEKVSELISSFTTASWGTEERDYHICVQVSPGTVGDEMLAARVSLVVAGATEQQALVRAVWTEDIGLSTRIVPEVAHYTGQVQLAAAIQEGLAARAEGDTKTATVKLGQAVRLATESGNSQTVKLLEKVVDVEDSRTGTVRLKATTSKGDEMELDTRSTKTVRIKKG
jgi:von Willebrand factor type A C-terminal domain/von Willebrand factor type A domain